MVIKRNKAKSIIKIYSTEVVTVFLLKQNLGLVGQSNIARYISDQGSSKRKYYVQSRRSNVRGEKMAFEPQSSSMETGPHATGTMPTIWYQFTNPSFIPPTFSSTSARFYHSLMFTRNNLPSPINLPMSLGWDRKHKQSQGKCTNSTQTAGLNPGCWSREAAALPAVPSY